MKMKRKIKDGQIVVKNPLYQELPEHKVLRLIEQSPIDEKDKER